MSVEHFIARQPIFDKKQKVYAYELLFRSGLHNYFDCDDIDHASTSVIANSFLLFGLDEMTAGRRAFLNCTRKVLVEDLATALPKQHAVIEILETVEPDDEVIAGCKRLKALGYTLALDDFVYHEKFEPLLELADIVKVDFLISGPGERQRISTLLRRRGIRMLAEKVETREDYEQAVAMGYELFQGYFFSKPVILSRRDIPANKLQYLRVLKEIHSPELDFKKMAQTVQSEISLSYKLLKLINSAAFGLRHKVSNIVQALSLLGEREIRTWISLLAVSSMADDKPAELVMNSLIRARFCEQAAYLIGEESQMSALFLMGLFSQLDAILDRPLAELLDEIQVSSEMRQALLEKEGKRYQLLELGIALERGYWDNLSRLASAMELEELLLSEAYLGAVKWARGTYL
ncbi:MAG: HDOD domain-containing protein [Geopsychrobacter sp.]|nr:HDOD domain-containing protein [Geopsychrobacter sp.]